MAQLRMALRVYALQDPSPTSVLRSVHRLVSQLPMPEMVTLLYASSTSVTHTVRYERWPPTRPRLRPYESVLPERRTRTAHRRRPEAFYREEVHELEPGSTLLLYTDGLVERRGSSITEGLDRLSEAAKAMAGEDLERLCDHLLRSMIVPGDVADDVALIAVRPCRSPAGRSASPSRPRHRCCPRHAAPCGDGCATLASRPTWKRAARGVRRSLRERRPACLRRGSG